MGLANKWATRCVGWVNLRDSRQNSAPAVSVKVRMFRTSSPLPSLLVAALLALLSGCEPRTPELLQLFDATPKQVEVHDSLVLRGAGFPPGEVGVVELYGVVHHSGTEAKARFSWDARVQSETEERAVLEVDEAMVSAFTQTDDGPRHATFRGQATLSFAPNLRGAPPIRGEANIVLDVFPPKDAMEGTPSSEEISEFYGAEFRRSPLGVEVTSVVAEGRLARAQVAAGDHVLSFDGLSALNPTDLEPRAGQARAVLELSQKTAHPSAAPTVLGVDVAGYRPQRARLWKWGLALLAPFSILLLLSHARFAHALGVLLSSATTRAKASALRLLEKPVENAHVPDGFAAFLGVSVVFAAMQLDLLGGLSSVDLVVCYVAAASLELVGAFLGGGTRRSRWSLWKACGTTWRSLPLHLTLALALLSPVLEHGTLSLASPGHDAHWHIAAFASPGGFLACCVLVALGLGSREWAPHGVDQRGLLPFMRSASALLIIGAAIAAFFGGWTTPGWLSGGPTVALVWFELKLTFGYILWLSATRSFGENARFGFAGWVAGGLLPLSLCSVLLTPVWLADVWEDWVRQAVQWTLVGTTLLLALGALAALATRRRRATQSTINPWI